MALEMREITYFSRPKAGEAMISIFAAALAHPTRLFAQMPAEVLAPRDSANLYGRYLILPSMMLSMVTGIFTAIVIIPVSLAIGLGTSWLWAGYLSWAARRFAGNDMTQAKAFQILAYSGPPLAIAWGPYLGLPMAIWHLFISWRGLVSFGGLGKGAALLIELVGILLLLTILVLLGWIVMLLIPENVEIVRRLTVDYLHSRGWL